MERILELIKLDLLDNPDICRLYDSPFISKRSFDFAPRLHLLDETGCTITSYLISKEEWVEVEETDGELGIMIKDMISNFWREQNINKVLNG